MTPEEPPLDVLEVVKSWQDDFTANPSQETLMCTQEELLLVAAKLIAAESELSTQRDKLEACREEHRCVVDNLCAALMPDSPIENARGEFSLDAMGACQIIGRMRDELSTLETYCTDLGKTISGMGEELSTCRAQSDVYRASSEDRLRQIQAVAKERDSARSEAKRYRQAIVREICSSDCAETCCGHLRAALADPTTQPQVEREWRCVWGFDCCTVGFTEARCDEFIRRNPEMNPRKQSSIDGGKSWVDVETGS